MTTLEFYFIALMLIATCAGSGFALFRAIYLTCDPLFKILFFALLGLIIPYCGATMHHISDLNAKNKDIKVLKFEGK